MQVDLPAGNKDTATPTDPEIHKNLRSRAQLELKQLNTAWEYKNIQLIQDMMYALCLCIGFGLYCLCPPAILGAGLLAGVSLVYSITKPYVDILQVQANTRLIDKEVDIKKEFIKGKMKNTWDINNLDSLDPAIKMACVDILIYEQQINREKIITDNKQKLIKITTVLNIIMPVFAFACLLTLPTGIGFGVMAGITLFVVGAAFLYHYKCSAKSVSDLEPALINDQSIKNLLNNISQSKATRQENRDESSEGDGRNLAAGA